MLVLMLMLMLMPMLTLMLMLMLMLRLRLRLRLMLTLMLRPIWTLMLSSCWIWCTMLAPHIITGARASVRLRIRVPH